MARSTEVRKEAVSIGGHDVRFEYDEASVKDIAKNCGSKSVRQSYSYLGVLAYRGGCLTCAVIDDVAFFAGTFSKKHFRLVEIAVKQEAQRSGYGRYMIGLIKAMCNKKGLNKITLRTAKDETAREFYQKVGGVVVGSKGEDWEMEIIF